MVRNGVIRASKLERSRRLPWLTTPQASAVAASAAAPGLASSWRPVSRPMQTTPRSGRLTRGQHDAGSAARMGDT